jgi:hypothetical protein
MADGRSQPISGEFKNHARSASSSAGANCSRCTPSFMVFERGSSTGMMRAPPTRARSPRTVVSMAVGWCAKSSYTVTSLTTPRISMRRLTPRNRASACAARAGSTPTCRAAAIAASAFMTLCSPSSGQFTSATALPWKCTAKRLAADPGGICALQSAPANAKVSRGVQAPMPSVAASSASAPLTMSRPAAGRTGWTIVITCVVRRA